MKHLKRILVFVAALYSAFFAGCATTLDPTAEDYQSAALSCLDQLYQDGVLDNLENVPTIKVSRIINRTSYNVQTDWITSIIISNLNRQGKVRALTEDRYMKEKAEWEALIRSDGNLDGMPTFADVTLSGKIYEDHHRVGRRVEKNYMFRLELNKDGVIWGGPYLHSVSKSRAF